ncbi:MAG: PAAR domain-containing protein [Candidatus Aenigmatarchaeota archaeon]
MGAAVVRLGDSCSGHGCFPARNNDQGSPNVFVNGKPAHRVGDHWVTHCCLASCHDGTASSGSGTVFVNGKPICRVGDSVSCGSTMAQGSPNVFAG